MKTNTSKKRPTLAQQYARLKAGNARLAARLKAIPSREEWAAALWRDAFKAPIRRP